MTREKWQKDLSVYRDINTTFIVEGNVHDLQPWIYEEDGICEPIPLSKYFHRYLSECGYDTVVFYNRVDGFYNPYCQKMVDSFYRTVGIAPNQGGDAISNIRKCLGGTSTPSAIIIDLANTIATSPDNLDDEEIDQYVKLMLASMAPVQALTKDNNKPLTNLLFLIVEKVNDIPTWVYLNNPYVRTLTISRPEKDTRLSVVSSRLDSLNGARELTDESRNKIIDDFATHTEGMTLVELFGVLSLCRLKGYSVFQYKDAIKMYRYGETESHWDKIDIEKVKHIEEYLSKRVKGQKRAVEKASSILSRACIGLSGIQGGSNSRPKGVMFLAGPTGTGKTELAKTIAELVFGDDAFVTRFDMSEYQQAHSDQKLLGAPPGYVGYSEGGQLTNAIKQNPFCVLLFDEIDKAHPSIMDKFLQILEDGRMTDSAGETVYFSEALIVFTSNLGVVGIDQDSGKRYQTISQDMAYEQLEQVLLSTIKDYFKYSIQRPELLNRIGDNFIVFDYIRENVVQEILDINLCKIFENLQREKGITLHIQDPFREQLLKRSKENLENGGRGIGNVVETILINQLSKVLVKELDKDIKTITLLDYDEINGLDYRAE